MSKATSGWLWHRRLGHVGMKNLQTLISKEHVIGLNEVKFDKDRLCSSCEAVKITKKHHSAKKILTTTGALELLHMDLFRPQIMLVLEVTSMVSLLLMISLTIPGYSFSMTRAKLSISSKLLLRDHKPSMNYL